MLVATVIGAAAVSLVWLPHDPALMTPNRFAPPGALHWLGTDWFGRDVAARLMVGAQTSVVVGIVAVTIGLLIGGSLGAIAAARGGWLDDLIMRMSDVIFAFPAIVSALLITTYLGVGAVNAIIAIGIFNIPVFARVTRSSAVQIWGQDFVRAATALGKGRLRLTLDHVLPNLAAVLIVQATIQFALAILAEAALSFLGLGVQPPSPSWGRMLFESRTMVALAPSLAIFPGLTIAVAVLGLNLLGDGLRDALDPRLARAEK